MELSEWFGRRRRRRDDNAQSSFDAAFYRNQFSADEDPGDDPWDHYRRVGWRGGADPVAWVSTSDYLSRYPDVRAAGVEPFTHFFDFGRHEGRVPSPSRAALEPATFADGSSAEHDTDDDVRAARLVDTDYYLACNPDVREAGIDPARHFMQAGWADGRDPCRWFSVSFYLRANPDVANAGINPFLHYLATGAREGRLPQDPLGHRRLAIESHVTLAQRIGEWMRDPAAELLDETQVVEELRAATTSSDRGRLRVILGNDDAFSNTGGAQACIVIEHDELQRHGTTALYAWPHQPLPCLSLDEDPVMCLRLDRREIGCIKLSALMDACRTAQQDGHLAIDLVIHGLLGQAPERIARTLTAPDRTFARATFWAHDYTAACSSFTLTPSGVDFCGAPPATSTRCRTCSFGADREAHIARVSTLLSVPSLEVVAPSDSAAQVWRSATGYEGPIAVQPIGTITESGVRRRMDPRADRVISIAFVGAPVSHKGWFRFLDLRTWLVGRPDVELHHVGRDDQRLPGVMFHEVEQVDGETHLMTRALMAAGIDVVFHWPSWPETFGITASEAIAAGCVVLTGTGSGNIARMSEDDDRVLIMSETSLDRALHRGTLVDTLRHAIPDCSPTGSFALGNIARLDIQVGP